MIGPRDTPPQFGVPVHADTGIPLTDHQLAHLDAIKEAGELLYAVMHDAEGSQMPGQYQEHSWGGRRMAHAATLLETALMFARKAAIER
jgi:hypothetical protein